jgi:hypothetical protein
VEFGANCSGKLWGMRGQKYGASPRRYRLLDAWWSHREFEIFRVRFRNEVERFDALLQSDGIASKFEVVGTYYDERGDGGDLVAT